MLKSTAAVACCLFITTALSVSSLNAMPAPEAGDSELSAGLAQWGAESEAPELSQAEMLKHLDELAPPTQQKIASKPASSKAAMCETLAAAAQENKLPVGFFVRLINQESGFDPKIVSSAGAQGVAQFMPEVAKEWGLKNPFDPHAALMASARFLRSLFDQFGNWGLAAAAYNGGGGRVQKWLDKRGTLPAETRHYVQTITGVPPERWVGTRDRGTFTLPARAPCQEIAHLADAPAGTGHAALPVGMQVAAGPPSKTTGGPVVSVRRPMQVALIKVRGKVAPVNGKVAALKGKIAEPKSIVAEAGSAKDKGSKKAPVKVAEKPAAKMQAKSRDSKKAKGRVQLADARGARK